MPAIIYPEIHPTGNGAQFIGLRTDVGGGVIEFVGQAGFNPRIMGAGASAKTVADALVQIGTEVGGGAALVALAAALGLTTDVATTGAGTLNAHARAMAEILNSRLHLTGPAAMVHSVAAIGSTSTLAKATNAARAYALLVNDSDLVMYLGMGVAAVLNQGIRLAPGGSYEMSGAFGNLYSGAINAIHGGTSTKTLLITEG